MYAKNAAAFSHHLVFDCSFCVTANSKQDAACRLTPRFIDFLTKFDRDVEGQILSFCWEGKIFSLVLETDFGIATIASSVDLSDLDAARRSYIRSLKELGSVLDRLIEGPALTDVVFAKSGPACVSGPCPEGKMCCGKTAEVRAKYASIKEAAGV